MSMLDKHLAFVNGQLSFHKQRATQYSSDSIRYKKHMETAGKFAALLEDMRVAQSATSPAIVPMPTEARPKQLRLSLTPKDIDGLPDELMEELSVSNADKAEFAISSLMDEAGGVMSLDQIIVGLYRQTKEINKRQTITSRLYRMAQRGLVFSTPRKGVYSTKQLTEDEFAKLTGVNSDDSEQG